MAALTADVALAIGVRIPTNGENGGLAPIDYTNYTDLDLSILATQIRAEQQRRATLASASAQINQINQQCMAAQGVVTGQPWVQPTDATNAYPRGWIVTFGGDTWESLIPANTHQPEDPNDPQTARWWKNLTVVPTPGAWDGNFHAYAVGDVVTYHGVTYKCIQAHTSQPGWSPVAVPALWTPVAPS